MCWSGEASAVVAAVGFASTGYAAWRREPAPLWAALGYFSLMEALQAYSYTVIDDCSNPANQVLTLLGYIHIVFQPFFANAMALYFVPAAIRQRVAVPVYALCFCSTVFMLLYVYPFDWAGTCELQRTLCAEQLCSVSGNWHIAWNIPLNGIGNYFLTLPIFLQSSFLPYLFTMFALPVIYGSWRIPLYHVIMGPAFAAMLTDNKNELPAVWCLLTIGFLLIAIKTPVRGYLHVRHWPLWPMAWAAAAAAPAQPELAKPR